MNVGIRICYLYGDLMNIYGDRGNIITVLNRLTWRGLEYTLTEVSIGQPLKNGYDLYFFGGGQDQEQEAVGTDLIGEKGELIHTAVEEGAALLAVCGGYQLLGEYYQPFTSERVPGTGLFSAYTKADKRRMIGNVVVHLSKDVYGKVHAAYPGVKRVLSTLVGFENHSGKTVLTAGKPIGQVVVGNGNNGEDGEEGCMYKNAIGCYLHGSLLPKNPHLADFLIAQALWHRYKEHIPLELLDDTLEWQAHAYAVKRAHMLQ